MNASAFAARLSLNALAGMALAAAGFICLPLLAELQTGFDFLLWLGFAIAAAAALGLSCYLLFDSMLFALLASHADERAGGHAVDDFLARAGLRKMPPANRPLSRRVAGTLRLLYCQRAALLVFLALFVFMAARGIR